MSTILRPIHVAITVWASVRFNSMANFSNNDESWIAWWQAYDIMTEAIHLPIWLSISPNEDTVISQKYAIAVGLKYGTCAYISSCDLEETVYKKVKFLLQLITQNVLGLPPWNIVQGQTYSFGIIYLQEFQLLTWNLVN